MTTSGVQRGAAGRHPVQCVNEFADVRDPVLEQVPDTSRALSGSRTEQVGRVPGLDVLGEHQQSQARVFAAQRDRGPQALVGVPGRHAHVHDGDVRAVLLYRGAQGLGVTDGGHDLVAATGQDLCETGPDHGGVLGDHDPQ